MNAAIDALVRARDEARSRRDFATADALRAELLAIVIDGPVPYRVALLDEPQGTFWYWTARGK